ncbi:helix-turn-helix domain-containing protein [Viridibacillus arvi]|uniref:helix-turn-helix domain-containing protein n=1 Tax=Viridibacillus arvi TaxID=263475 RepID=UPI0034CF35F5
MKRIRRLTDNSELLEQHPELGDVFNSTSAIYGKIIFAVRMEQKLTQKDLSEKAGVTIKNIARVEGGAADLDTDQKTYDNLFEALNLSAQDVQHLFSTFTEGQQESATLCV